MSPIGHSTNLVGIPTGLLANVAFNDHPLPLHISGVRELNPALFRMLAEAESQAEAAEAFTSYMHAVFGLEGAAREEGAPRRYRSSYRRLLAGWGFDANGAEGAVLKGWVESRFGLLPTFHRKRLGRYPSPAWIAYVEQKMSSRFHNNAIQAQLDLLYEYCQWWIARFMPAGCGNLRLYRGVNDFAEHEVIERVDKRTLVVRQNNLVSFSSGRETADRFGDTILEVEVPVVKIVFFNDLLAGPVLRGEGEYLVIGGDYRVSASYL